MSLMLLGWRTVTERLTVTEWAAILSDPVRDQRYTLTGLGQTIPGFLTELEVSGRSAATKDQYERDLARVALTHPDKGVGEWDEIMCLNALLQFKPGSRRRARAAMSGLFVHAWRMRLIPENPMLRMAEIPKPKQQIVEVFTDDDEARLCSVREVRDSALVRLLLGTGIRKGEARALQRRHVKEAVRQLHVVSGKGSKGRIIPLTDNLVTILMELVVLEGLNDDDYLWYTSRGGQYRKIIRNTHPGEASFVRWWVRCLDEAGVEYRKPHTTRHTFATKYLRAGGRIEKLARILGHSSVAITDTYYTHLVTEDLAADLDRVQEARGL